MSHWKKKNFVEGHHFAATTTLILSSFDSLPILSTWEINGSTHDNCCCVSYGCPLIWYAPAWLSIFFLKKKGKLDIHIGDENDVFDFIKPNEKESRTLRADLIYVFFFCLAFWNRNEYPIFIWNQNENSENSLFFFRHNDF